MEATKPAADPGRARRVHRFAALAAGVALASGWAGCRAEVAEQTDDASVHDLSADDDGGVTFDFSGVDGAPGADLSCPAGPVEICGNGCDDDRNGYTDDDDPACTPQVLATWVVSTPLERLTLLPPYATSVLDGNAVPTAAHGVYSRAFAPGVVFLSVDGFTSELLRVTLPPGGGKGMVETISTSYFTHDVCIFNGELIVVERGGTLHRLKADGKTENGTVTLPTWMPANSMYLTSCSTDGKLLYVSEHPAGAQPSQFEILDTLFSPAPSPVPISNQLLSAGIDRCLDFAFARGNFYGLFANSQASDSDAIPPDELVTFALDGGVGPAIDAGVLHGIGEFLP